jgi:hypothetical protein
MSLSFAHVIGPGRTFMDGPTIELTLARAPVPAPSFGRFSFGLAGPRQILASRQCGRNRHSRELALPSIERQGRIEAWIVTDAGFRTSRSPIPCAMSMLSADASTTCNWIVFKTQ